MTLPLTGPRALSLTAAGIVVAAIIGAVTINPPPFITTEASGVLQVMVVSVLLASGLLGILAHVSGCGALAIRWFLTGFALALTTLGALLLLREPDHIGWLVLMIGTVTLAFTIDSLSRQQEQQR